MKKIAILLLSFISLTNLSLVFFKPEKANHFVKAEDSSVNEEGFYLESKGDKITVNIPAIDGEVRLVRFRANQYHSSTSFIKYYDGQGDDNQDDGYDVDRNYYSPNQKGYIEATVSKTGIINIDRYSAIESELGHDKTYDRFYLVKNGSVIDNMLAGGDIVAPATFVRSFDSKLTYPRQEMQSIKGLEVKNSDDAEKLGISHSMVGMDINTIILGMKTEDSIEYVHNGKSYYFSQKLLKIQDERIINMTNAGMSVTLSFLIYGKNTGIESILLHPDYAKLNNFPMNLTGINTTTIKALDLFAATASFLADRYTREDRLYGHVDNFIVGNEIESACQWNNMGYLPIEEYIRQYERALRIAYISIKSIWQYANVLACTSHFWNLDCATQYLNYDAESYGPFVGHGSYTTRNVLTELNKASKLEGDYYWQLAYHPYRANAIGEAAFWNDVNYVASSHDEMTAAKVTPLNIDVLYNFLKKDENRFEGKERCYYITEYGAGTPHTGTYASENISQQALNEQAASFAYSYYMFLFNGAKSYVIHRHIDSSYEDGENLGIWFRKTNSEEEPYEKKPVWEVMKYIDTPLSLQYTTPYLKYIRVLPQNTIPTSWSELIPNFDANKLEHRILEKNKEMVLVDDYKNSTNDDFENETTNGWLKDNNAISCEIIKDDGSTLNTTNILMVQYQSVATSGKGMAEKGIRKEFEKPIKTKNLESFNFSLFIENNDNEKSTHNVKVRFYSGNQIIECCLSARNNEAHSYSIKVDDEFKKTIASIEKIKIWYSSTDDNAPGGTLYFDNVGFVKTKTNNTLPIILIIASSLLFLGGVFFLVLILRRARHGKNS